MEMKEKCEMALRAALRAERAFPALFPDNALLGIICDHYGTEFVADCLMEMGLTSRE